MPACPHCRTDCNATHRFCHSCGKELGAKSGDPLVGSTLPGGYVIGQVIAEGGMGRIYRAEQRALERSVAVKVVHPHLLSDPEIRSRFFVEARTASRLNHPNAVRIIAFGEVPGGQPYLVMELLGGTPLTTLAAAGPIPLPRVSGLVTQALGALEHAHSLGIVHRDFKPDNVIVESLRSGADLVKVIDFGLAHLLSETPDDGRTGPSAAAGTPSYMSPEQARGERVDGRSDVYSAGIVLYELVTGHLPFEGETATQTLLAVVNDRPIDPRERAPERNITEALVAVMMRALAKERSVRFQSAHELAAALTAALPAEPVRHSRPPRAPSIPPPAASEAVCAACGTRNPAARAFCGECGASLVVRGKEGSR